MTKYYEKRIVEGTGAALNVACGYIPTKVVISRDDVVGKMVWFSHMSDGTALREGDPTDSAGLLTQPALTVGTTATNVATEAFDYIIANVAYSKAAVAAGTAPTATTVPDGTWGLFGFEIAADGTIDNNDAADNDTGYATEALAIAALPAVSGSHIMIGYMTIQADGDDFVGATDDISPNTDVGDYNFYTTAKLGELTSGGISQLDSSSGIGFTIGVDGVFNIDGKDMVVEIWR